MSFYMITYGHTRIEELYIGKTEDAAVSNARGLIDQWPEYAALTDEEIIKLAKNGDAEFDLVEIHAAWPNTNHSQEQLIAIYEQQQS
ncbi:hypothetical protein [Pseudomonas frederiksbergensis]|uniref:hypothetical protein n=1 Tax=Pseudomonas frederiksbergensis TaxID=104087 RepID=UPI002DBC4D40|nr:hypothetical protein [Pseudomonas frederiksbergensis]WRV68790.1 hypothetical protein VQ575_01640 [Pseudomonas frederiksbergensis]